VTSPLIISTFAPAADNVDCAFNKSSTFFYCASNTCKAYFLSLAEFFVFELAFLCASIYNDFLSKIIYSSVD
jgi:hypothetical protein